MMDGRAISCGGESSEEGLMYLKVVNRVCLELTFCDGVFLLIFHANDCGENTFSLVDASVHYLYLHDALGGVVVSHLHRLSPSGIAVHSVFEIDSRLLIHHVLISIDGMTFCG